MNAVDTNVLIYTHDPRDLRKQNVATSLVENLDNGVLLWQVACEYISASRKLQSPEFTVESAMYQIEVLRDSWSLSLPTWNTHRRARVLLSQRSLSWWDSLLIAACLEAGVTKLYTEDMAAGARFDGLEIINPFIGG